MKLKPELAQKYLTFLNKHKHLFGLDSYKIALKPKVPRRDTPLAETQIDRFEKELVVELSTEFMRLPEDRQRNILIHELIHARVTINRMRFEESVDKIRYEFEEEMVNELTAGIMIAKEVDSW